MVKEPWKWIGFSVNESMQVHCDNQAAIYIASNVVFHERTKHTKVDFAVLSEKRSLKV